jgi:hypothetical protein
MRWIILLATFALSGCAVYTTVNTAAFLATDKSLTDHAVTQAVPKSDCNVTNVFKGQYYCEIRDISKTYNRNPL